VVGISSSLASFRTAASSRLLHLHSKVNHAFRDLALSFSFLCSTAFFNAPSGSYRLVAASSALVACECGSGCARDAI